MYTYFITNLLTKDNQDCKKLKISFMVYNMNIYYLQNMHLLLFLWRLRTWSGFIIDKYLLTPVYSQCILAGGHANEPVAKCRPKYNTVGTLTAMRSLTSTNPPVIFPISGWAFWPSQRQLVARSKRWPHDLYLKWATNGHSPYTHTHIYRVASANIYC